MFSASTETYVAWVALLLVLAFALSIVSEVHAALTGHTGQPFSEAVNSVHAMKRALD